MKCEGCGFELPEDWPIPAGGKVLCVPCERRIEGGGADRGGAMTT